MSGTRRTHGTALSEVIRKAHLIQQNHHLNNLRFLFIVEEEVLRGGQRKSRKTNIESSDSRNTLHSNSPTDRPAHSSLESIKRPLMAALSDLLKTTIKLRLTNTAQDKIEEVDNDDLELVGNYESSPTSKLTEEAFEKRLQKHPSSSPRCNSPLLVSSSGKNLDKKDLDPQEETSRKDLSEKLDYILQQFNINSNILDYCYKDRNMNISFQHFIMICDQGTLDIIVSKVNEHLYTIMKDKYGNYLIQKLIKRDAKFMKKIEAVSKSNFTELAENEYSSRVLQALVYESSEFRLFVHQYFRNNLVTGISKISSMFILLIAIKCSSSSLEYVYIVDQFVANPLLFEYKLFKRVLIGYIQFADDMTVVDRIWKTLSGMPFGNFFDLKFGALILLMLVKRGHQKAMTKIALSIHTSLPNLVTRRYFKLVAEKLLHPKYAAIHSLVSEALQQTSIETLNEIREKSKTDFYFVVYLIISSHSKESDKQQLQRFVAEVELKFGSLPREDAPAAGGLKKEPLRA